MSTVHFEMSKKNVDRRSELLVSGYFREYQSILANIHQNNPYYNIPKLALITTLSYSATIEMFAMSLLDKIINAQGLTDGEKERISATDSKIIDALIKHQIGEKENEFPEYINKYFKSWVEHQNIIKFNINLMSTFYPLFIDLFMDNKYSEYFLYESDNNLLDFNYISMIFCECEEIQCFKTDPVKNVFTGQGFMWLDSLINILQKINENKKTKLKRLRIFGKRDLNDTELYDNFAVYMDERTGWKLNKLENQLVIERE